MTNHHASPIRGQRSRGLLWIALLLVAALLLPGCDLLTPIKPETTEEAPTEEVTTEEVPTEEVTTEEVTTEDATTEEITTEAPVLEVPAVPIKPIDPLAEVDLEGQTIELFVSDCTQRYFLGAETGDSLSRAVYSRDREAEKLIHAAFQIQTASYFDHHLLPMVLNQAMMGLGCVVIGTGGTELNTLAVNGVLANLLGAGPIRLDQTYYDHDLVDATMLVDGFLPFVGGALSIGTWNYMPVLFANRSLLESCLYDAADDVFDAALQGDWTLELLQDTVHMLSATETPALHYTQFSLSGVLIASGIRLAYREADEIVSILNSTKIAECNDIVFEWKRLLLSDNCNEVMGDPAAIFANGDSAFLLGNLTYARGMKDLTFDCEILPIPKFDKAQKTYLSAFAFDRLITVGVAYPGDVVDSCAAVEALSRASSSEWKAVCRSELLQGFDSDFSAKMFDEIVGHPVYDIAAVWQPAEWDKIARGAFQRDSFVASYVTYCAVLAERLEDTICQLFDQDQSQKREPGKDDPTDETTDPNVTIVVRDGSVLILDDKGNQLGRYEGGTFVVKDLDTGKIFDSESLGNEVRYEYGLIVVAYDGNKIKGSVYVLDRSGQIIEKYGVCPDEDVNDDGVFDGSDLI